MEYEYEEAMEDAYRKDLLKSFKKQVCDAVIVRIYRLFSMCGFAPYTCICCRHFLTFFQPLQIDNQHFNFIIVDAVNEKKKQVEEFWSYAKMKGFQVLVCAIMPGLEP